MRQVRSHILLVASGHLDLGSALPCASSAGAGSVSTTLETSARFSMDSDGKIRRAEKKLAAETRRLEAARSQLAQVRQEIEEGSQQLSLSLSAEALGTGIEITHEDENDLRAVMTESLQKLTDATITERTEARQVPKSGCGSMQPEDEEDMDEGKLMRKLQDRIIDVEVKCPLFSSADQVASARFHVTDTYTFEDVFHDSCTYWGLVGRKSTLYLFNTVWGHKIDCGSLVKETLAKAPATYADGIALCKKPDYERHMASEQQDKGKMETYAKEMVVKKLDASQQSKLITETLKRRKKSQQAVSLIRRGIFQLAFAALFAHTMNNFNSGYETVPALSLIQLHAHGRA